MFEYELIQNRVAELHREAEHDRLVREARAARTARQRTGAVARLARGVRRPVARPRAAQLGEC
ncbi:hypothetical protein [Saccharothrix sp. ST-888]|uniref:hypothetical protein n=1 Tax=Saccharothrix sp. ST-888 TaxID=1427391 RepID=UPI0005EC3537|nr:hypothetical protein [Saccharothrix sp. ST-888]KJK58106.1 hypothetical protein UK12_12425 [Saccharothrix sp. ST-888]